MDNNECDSGDSSLVVDDEPPSSSLNSSTEENRDELENHLNGTSCSTAKSTITATSAAAAAAATTATAAVAATTKIIEPAVGSDWYLYCDENFTNVNLIEEKIYEDLCYVTFSTKPEVRLHPTVLLPL